MASGTPVLPGGDNTFVRSFGEGSDKLVVGFSRNPKKFAINEYIQIRDVTLRAGFYLNITPQEAGRIVNANLEDFVWPDGADRPQNNDGTELFAFHDYATQRFNFHYKLGDNAKDQAAWGITENHEAIKAQQAMTGRTQRVWNVLNNPANWDAAHVANVAAIPGNSGPWDQSTTARNDIQRSIEYAADQILKSTLGVVEKEDLRIVMNPTTARGIAITQELKEHLKGSRYSLPQFEQVSNSGPGKFDQFGLPSHIYGYRVIVDKTVKVTSRRGAPVTTTEFVVPDGIVCVLARPGGLVAPPGGGPSFSTCSLFMYEDMSTETFDDRDNRRTRGNVVDDNQPVVTASASGFRFTGVLT